LGLTWLPVVSAQSDFDKFPDIPFKVFSDFVQQQLGETISLASVLTVLFSLTGNPDLLGLHARQQHPKVQGEIKQLSSGWIKVLSSALLSRLDKTMDILLEGETQRVNQLATKLDSLSKLLGLDPYNGGSVLKRRLKPVDENEIAPVRVICPLSMECETQTCDSRAILKYTRDRDISYPILIGGTSIYQAVVVAGQCPTCKTIYYADHEHSVHNGKEMKLYLNSAKYLKVGQKVWVNRIFSSTVINAFYNFHASSSAFAEFWNMSFWSTQNSDSRKITRRQVWQAFVQESIRRIAETSGRELELPDNLPIDEVTQQAFANLGEKGVMRRANNHTCKECTHDYKATADVIDGVQDPAALVGVDEHQNVPAFTGEREIADVEEDRMEVDDDHHVENAPVTMAVMDGLVVGHKHCAIDGCTANLANYQTGVYCQHHQDLYGEMCHMVDCENPKTDNTLTCIQHQAQWNAHVLRFGRTNFLGVQRLLRRNEEERLPWVSASEHTSQPHDEPAPQQSQVKHHFRASRFYCIETICAPCGVVIAWAKFDKAESETNILDFLDRVYPDKILRPDYVCIDKACRLLRHAVASGRWNSWKDTTRFIVDSYHYINHRTTDELCRTYCNPAPLNGSAPNLVEVVKDKFGRPHYKRAFNTEVCEQLNVCIGGWETILKRMSGGNFDWFLHSMLFVHTDRVLQKQKEKLEKLERDDEDDGDDEDEDEV
jgi:hypothetical protein